MEKTGSTRISVTSRLQTDTPLLSGLIESLRKGEIKVPQFQRPFVWKAQQALELLDSIARNYPVGSLLLWRTRSKLAIERNIGDFSLPQTDDLEPTDYVLDGQQRLTVVYSCLGAPEKGSGFSASYDLRNGEFIESPEEPNPFIFPLRLMFETSRLLDFRTALRAQNADEKTNEIFDEIIKVFSNYRIPVVTLKELTVEEVCPIFERINSSGTRLSTYDLLVAATWTTTFDLNSKANEIRAALDPKGFGDIEGDALLKCLSAVQHQSVKRDDLVRLRATKGDDIDNLVSSTSGALLKAVDLLSTEFGVFSWDFLPYEALVVILSYIYSKKSILDENQILRAKQWFWRASFTERYRIGGDGFVSKDLHKVYDFVINNKGAAEDFGQLSTGNIWGKTIFRSNNSRSRAYILALASRKPRNLTNGAIIDPENALSAWNKKEFHHIYPRAYLSSLKEEDSNQNVHANICMLTASENKNVSNQDPHIYLPKCIKNLPDANIVLSSNLFPDAEKFDYSKATYEEFINARASLIQELVVALCEGKV